MSRVQSIVYEAINQPVLLKIPKTTKRLLDLGCGSGTLGRQIKQNINCDVVGITYSELEAALASKWLDRVLLCNIDCFDANELGQFDCIVCSHILEHLYHPQELLNRLHNSLTPEGMLIVALPNALYWKQRVEFLRGRFRYTDGGLMDRTHFRFFDWRTAHELLEQSGYKIVDSEVDGNFPLPIIRKLLPTTFSSWVDRITVKNYPGMFGLQFVLSCRSN